MPDMNFHWIDTIANTGDTFESVIANGAPKFLSHNGYWYAYGSNVTGLQYVYVRFTHTQLSVAILPISLSSFTFYVARALNPNSGKVEFSTHQSAYYLGYQVLLLNGTPALFQGPDTSSIPSGTYIYDSVDDVFAAPTYPITYRLTNCTAPSAPDEAAVGDTVTVPFVFEDGYGIVNDANVFVTNNGVVIPSTYANGHLTFTMPDPTSS